MSYDCRVCEGCGAIFELSARTGFLYCEACLENIEAEWLKEKEQENEKTENDNS